LLAELRKRTLTPEGQARIEALINDLGDDVFAVREKAGRELVGYGTLAVPFLRDAVKSQDLERRRRADACLRLIAGNDANALPGVTPRLLALRKPAGAAEALLAYFPYADEAMAVEVQTALTTLAQRDGKPDPALVQALDDKTPARRAAAAAALAGGGGPEARPMVRRILRDAKPSVRPRAALALALGRGQGATPGPVVAPSGLTPAEARPA